MYYASLLQIGIEAGNGRGSTRQAVLLRLPPFTSKVTALSANTIISTHEAISDDSVSDNLFLTMHF